MCDSSALQSIRPLGRVYSFGCPRPIFAVMATDEKRFEPRYRSKGIVTLLVEGSGPIPCSIYDVSPSGRGLGVETSADLGAGAAVIIDGCGFSAHGIVRFCY